MKLQKWVKLYSQQRAQKPKQIKRIFYITMQNIQKNQYKALGQLRSFNQLQIQSRKDVSSDEGNYHRDLKITPANNKQIYQYVNGNMNMKMNQSSNSSVGNYFGYGGAQNLYKPQFSLSISNQNEQNLSYKKQLEGVDLRSRKQQSKYSELNHSSTIQYTPIEGRQGYKFRREQQNNQINRPDYNMIGYADGSKNQSYSGQNYNNIYNITNRNSLYNFEAYNQAQKQMNQGEIRFKEITDIKGDCYSSTNQYYNNTSNPNASISISNKNNPMIDQIEHNQQRQIQILSNKLISNNSYIKTQLQQMLKLTAFTILVEDEKQIRNRIAQLNSEVRRIKLRSISGKKIQHHKNGEAKMSQLKENLRSEKTKFNVLATKLTLIHNYLKVTQDQRNRATNYIKGYDQLAENILNNPSQYSNYDNPKTSTYRSISPQLISTQKESARSLRKIPSKRRLTRQYCVDESEILTALKQYSQILRQSITQSSFYTNKKIQRLRKQKMNLKRQLQITKMKIIQINSQNRKYRVTSSNQVRRYSFSKRQIKNLSSQRSLKYLNLSQKKDIKNTLKPMSPSRPLLHTIGYQTKLPSHRGQQSQYKMLSYADEYNIKNKDQEQQQQSRKSKRAHKRHRSRDQNFKSKDVLNQYFNS